MNGYVSLADSLKGCMSSKKGITFIKDKEEFISYEELFKNSTGLLSQLQARSITKGEKLLFQLSDNKDFIITFWACILGGIVPVPVECSDSDEGKARVISICNVFDKIHIITNRKHATAMKLYCTQHSIQKSLLKALDSQIIIEDLLFKGEGKLDYTCGNETAFIQFSSGSTGRPKGVMLSHKNVISYINASVSYAGITGNDSSFSWLPLTHDMGLIGFHISALLLNGDQYLMPTALFIKDPFLWLDKVSEHKNTILASPNFGFKYILDKLQEPGCTHANWALDNVRLIFNGAEAISKKVCMDFLAEMQQYNLHDNTIYNVYGMAEATLGITFPPPSEGLKFVTVDRNNLNIGQDVKETSIKDKNAINFADLGYAVSSCEFKICDESYNDLGFNKVGYIYIHGDSVTKGYYNDRRATETAFQPDGWLNTGDLGFSRDGRLVVTGRAKEIIIINGKNYYPQDIEKMISDNCAFHDDVAVCGVANVSNSSEDVIVFFKYSKDYSGFPELVKKTNQIIIKNLNVSPKYVIPLSIIPKTESNKIKRNQLKEDFVSGKFSFVIDEIDELLKKSFLCNNGDIVLNDTETQLLKICKNILDTEWISIDDNLGDWGSTSMQIVRIFHEIDKAYPNTITMPDIFSHPTVRKLAALINSSGLMFITTLTFPKKMLNDKNGPYELIVYEAKLNNNDLSDLNEFAKQEDVSVKSILISICAYLLSKVTGKDTVSAQLKISDNTIIPFHLDFKSAEYISTFFKNTENICSKKEVGYNIRQLNRVGLYQEKDQVGCLFVISGKIESKDYGLFKIFDLVIDLSNWENGGEIAVKFNGSKLSRNKIRDFFTDYLNLVIKACR